jgi:hypothetical protein
MTTLQELAAQVAEQAEEIAGLRAQVAALQNAAPPPAPQVNVPPAEVTVNVPAAPAPPAPEPRPLKFELRIPGAYGHDKVAYLTPIYAEGTRQ